MECNKNKENGNPLSTDIIDIKQPVSHRRDIKPPNDDSRDDIPTRRESMQYSSINATKSKSINMGSSGNKQKASPTSVRTKLNDSGGSNKKKSNSRGRRSAEWLDQSTDSSSSIEIDNNNILYLSPKQQQQMAKKDDDKNNTTSLLDLTNDITLTPSASFLQLDISNHDKEEMNVLECSEITLDSSFLIELDNDKDDFNNRGMVADTVAVNMSISSRLDVSDNMKSDEIEIVMNTHQIITQEATTEVSNVSIDTPTDDEPTANVQQHILNNSTITCDEFITEALQTSFIENVKLGYNVVTNKLEKEFIDMGFADCISG